MKKKPEVSDGSRVIDASFKFEGHLAARMVIVVDKEQFPNIDAKKIFNRIVDAAREEVNFQCDIDTQGRAVN